MTAVAIPGKDQSGVVGIVRCGIFELVARVAIGRRAGVPFIPMAIGAAGAVVGAHECESRATVIERRLPPSRRTVAGHTRSRKSSRGVTRARGRGIRRLVTGYARRRCAAETATGVAGAAIGGAMRALQPEPCGRMIEARPAPTRGRVALRALRTESSMCGFVHRRQLRLVACSAILRRCARGLRGVARGTLQRPVRAGQLKPGGCMFEARALPRRRRRVMTTLTFARHAGRFVVGRCCRRVLRDVTTDALGRDAGDRSFATAWVTARALDECVQSAQRKPGSGVNLQRSRTVRPCIRRVAFLATQTFAPGMNVPVAVGATCCNAREDPRLMTFFTRRRRVFPQQRESGGSVVEVDGLTHLGPGLRRVADLAGESQLAVRTLCRLRRLPRLRRQWARAIFGLARVRTRVRMGGACGRGAQGPHQAGNDHQRGDR